MRFRMLLGVAVVLVLGCGTKNHAPVSGRVTLNGKPLPNATVSFQPIANKQAFEAGPGSTGKTNASGEFTLKNMEGRPGAWVGEHRVAISVLATKAGEDGRRGGPPQAEMIPSRYNSKTELRYEVLPGGTTKAEFPLTSP